MGSAQEQRGSLAVGVLPDCAVIPTQSGGQVVKRTCYDGNPTTVSVRHNAGVQLRQLHDGFLRDSSNLNFPGLKHFDPYQHTVEDGGQ